MCVVCVVLMGFRIVSYDDGELWGSFWTARHGVVESAALGVAMTLWFRLLILRRLGLGFEDNKTYLMSYMMYFHVH